MHPAPSSLGSLSVLTRRSFLCGTGAVLASAGRRTAPAAALPACRAAVIGRERPNQRLVQAWSGVPNFIVAASQGADGTPFGMVRMLERVRPAVLGVTLHPVAVEPLMLAAERGVRGIYLDAPIFRSVGQIEALADMAEDRGLSICVRQDMRYHPLLAAVCDAYAAGAVGRLLEIRASVQARPRHDTWLACQQCIAVASLLGGPPELRARRVYEAGRAVSSVRLRQIAARRELPPRSSLHATYRLASGASFQLDVADRGLGTAAREVAIFGAGGEIRISMQQQRLQARYRPATAWSPGRFTAAWLPLGWQPGGAPRADDGQVDPVPKWALDDLLASLHGDRKPVSNLNEWHFAASLLQSALDA
jgi:hypothetical protein